MGIITSSFPSSEPPAITWSSALTLVSLTSAIIAIVSVDVGKYEKG